MRDDHDDGTEVPEGFRYLRRLDEDLLGGDDRATRVRPVLLSSCRRRTLIK